MTLSRSLPNIATNTGAIASHASSSAALESAHLIYEMTEHQVSALHAQHDREAKSFQTYERNSAKRIEALSTANSVDISGWREQRGKLLNERDEARKKDDRVGYFKVDALLAANNHYGLTKAGADPAEIERSKQEAEEARQRYLTEVEIQARKEAKAAGMAPDAAKEHIARARTAASNDLEEQKRKLAEEVGVPPELIEHSNALNGELRAAAKESRKERTSAVETRKQTVRSNPGKQQTKADLASFNVPPAASNDPLADAQGAALKIARSAPTMPPEADPEKSNSVTVPNGGARQVSQSTIGTP